RRDRALIQLHHGLEVVQPAGSFHAHFLAWRSSCGSRCSCWCWSLRLLAEITATVITMSLDVVLPQSSIAREEHKRDINGVARPTTAATRTRGSRVRPASFVVPTSGLDFISGKGPQCAERLRRRACMHACMHVGVLFEHADATRARFLSVWRGDLDATDL